MLFYTTFLSLSEICGQIFENIFRNLRNFFSGFSSAENLIQQKPLIPALFYQNWLIISLSLISVTLYMTRSIWQLFHHVFCLQVKTASFGFRWKLYCYTSSSHLTRENFVCRFGLYLSLSFGRVSYCNKFDLFKCLV